MPRVTEGDRVRGLVHSSEELKVIFKASSWSSVLAAIRVLCGAIKSFSGLPHRPTEPIVPIFPLVLQMSNEWRATFTANGEQGKVLKNRVIHIGFKKNMAVD